MRPYIGSPLVQLLFIMILVVSFMWLNDKQPNTDSLLRGPAPSMLVKCMCCQERVRHDSRRPCEYGCRHKACPSCWLYEFGKRKCSCCFENGANIGENTLLNCSKWNGSQYFGSPLTTHRCSLASSDRIHSMVSASSSVGVPQRLIEDVPFTQMGSVVRKPPTNPCTCWDDEFGHEVDPWCTWHGEVQIDEGHNTLRHIISGFSSRSTMETGHKSLSFLTRHGRSSGPSHAGLQQIGQSQFLMAPSTTCQCNPCPITGARCTRRPGRRIICGECSQGVGPGCCWNQEQSICHKCAHRANPQGVLNVTLLTSPRCPTFQEVHMEGALSAG